MDYVKATVFSAGVNRKAPTEVRAYEVAPLGESLGNLSAFDDRKGVN